VSDRPPRLLDRLREKVHLKHYSIRTEEAYAGWVRRFVRTPCSTRRRSTGPAEPGLVAPPLRRGSPARAVVFVEAGGGRVRFL
jgi:hypothetical protein